MADQGLHLDLPFSPPLIYKSFDQCLATAFAEKRVTTSTVCIFTTKARITGRKITSSAGACDVSKGSRKYGFQTP